MKLLLFKLRICIVTSVLIVALFKMSNAQNCPTGNMLTHDTNTTIDYAFGYNVVGTETRYYKNYAAFDADIIIDSLMIGIVNPGNIQIRIYAYTGTINAATLDTSLLLLLDTSAILMPSTSGLFTIPIHSSIPAGTKIVIEQRLIGGGAEVFVMGFNHYGNLSNNITYFAVPSEPLSAIPKSVNSFTASFFMYMLQRIYFHTVKYPGDTMYVCSSQLPLTVNGTLIDSSGVYDISYPNVAGCDSVVTAPIIVIESSANTGDSLIACNNELPLNINGVTMSTTGVYQIPYTNVAGCDSVVSVHLTAYAAINKDYFSEAYTINLQQAGATYQWINCNDNTIIEGENSQTFTASANGRYAAIITINGCSDTTTCVELPTLGVNQLVLNTGFDIYPNPVDEQLNLKFKHIEPGILKIIITDVNGRVLIKKEQDVINRNTQLVLDVKHLKSGIYFINVNGVNKKFVK